MTENELRQRIEIAAHEHGISPTTLCSYAVGNSRFYRNLKNGGTCTIKIANVILKWISDNSPTKNEDAA